MKDKLPLVSVIIPTHNRSDLLPRAVKSVLRQTYKNLELMIVDDCSTDNTSKIVQSFDDNRIKYIRSEISKRYGGACNIGFENSKGKYIALLDDDDEWSDEEKLKEQVNVFENNPGKNIGMVCTWWTLIFKHGKKQIRPKRPRCWEERILGYNNIICGSNVLISRQAWLKADGCDETITRGIDSDLFRRIILQGYETIILPKTTANIYIGREDRMGNKDNVERIQAHMQSEKDKLKKFPQEFKLYPKVKSRVLERIGNHYIRIWRITKKQEDCKQAILYFKKSFFTHLFNWKALIKYLISNLLQYKL